MRKSTCLVLLSVLMICNVRAQQFPDWSWSGFVRPEGVNPIISPDNTTRFRCPVRNEIVNWECEDTFNPGAAVYKGKVVVLYRAEDNYGKGIGKRTSRIGYASSEDGVHFKRLKRPVLYPDGKEHHHTEWPGGCEDPRVAMTEDGLYVMMYTQWNRKKARLSVATSRALKHWTKHGPAFKEAYDGRFLDMFTKSASIGTKVSNEKQVIAHFQGTYWMYWGERYVNVATSEDLINWTPMLDEKGELLKVMVPRKGYFDSDMTECGPPAIMTDNGIILFYNGRNKAGTAGDSRYTANSYCAGQALFDLKDPTKLIDRLDRPFFYPQDDFEKSGQYPYGTVFIQGLVYHKQKWFLYYGSADSRTGVAVRQ